jgi:hypothetical protein
LRIDRHNLLCWAVQPQAWHILHVGGKQKRPRVDDQHPKANALAAPVNFIGDVPPEHARTDDDNVKWIAAVVTHLRPRAAHPSAQDIVGKCGLLHIDNSTRVWIQDWQHESLHFGGFACSVNPDWNFRF